jgi:rubredoxin
MFKSITDNVCNDESRALVKAIINQGNDLNGVVMIEENPNSGWIYAADEDGNCWLFNSADWKEIEKHLYCPECGYENFESHFLEERQASCCENFYKKLG